MSQLHLHLQLATPGTTSHALPVAQPIHGCSVDMDLPVYLSCVLERPILLTKDENHQGYQHYVCSHVFTCVRACVRACAGIAQMVSSACQPRSYSRPPSFEPSFAATILHVLVWPAARRLGGVLYGTGGGRIEGTEWRLAPQVLHHPLYYYVAVAPPSICSRC